MRAFLQLLAVIGISLAGAGGTWWFVGPPDQSVVCDSAELEPGAICMETVMAGGPVLWIDARSREQWERNGIAGSLLVTDHPAEDFDALVAEAFPHIVAASRVVVYCGDSGCGSSKAVAASLRELEAGPEIFALHGGWKALAAAGMVKASK